MPYKRKKPYDIAILERIHPEMRVSPYLYLSGLLYLCRNLFFELQDELREENRYFGIVLSYTSTCRTYFTRMFDDVEDDDLDVYQRIIYLYKQKIIIEYRRLLRHGMSRADALITIFHRLLEIINEHPNCADFPKQREMRPIQKVIDRLFLNIRHEAKRSNMYNLTAWIKKFMDQGTIGKHSLPGFNIRQEESKRDKAPITDDGVRIDIEADFKITEVEWT